MATVAHVHVDVKPGKEEAFLKASLANATGSSKEPGCSRFDVLQDKEDGTKFILNEIFFTGDGAKAHKETQHYATWKETVAPIQTRAATKYVAKFPEAAESYSYPKTDASLVPPDDDTPLLAVHVYVDVKPGNEDAFLAASLANATESVKESGISRFDVLQQIDDPTKFVLVEVYKTAEAPAEHKATAHYATWKEAVADIQTRSSRKFHTRFPARSAW